MTRPDIFLLAFDALPSHIAVLDGEGAIVRVNAAWRRFAGENGSPDPLAYVGENYIEVCRRASSEGCDVAQEALSGIEKVYHSAASFFEMRYPCHAPSLRRWYSMTVTPLGDKAGLAIAHSDITSLVEAEQAKAQLVGELNHRVKNTLAIVQGIAQQTARSTPEPERFTVSFARRLGALSNAHDVLTRTEWRGADLTALVEAALAPFRDGGEAGLCINGGPEICLDASTAVSLHLTLHELATNAVKHGSLAVEGGRVDVAWELVADGGTLVITWIEDGWRGQPKAEHRGFGMRMLEALAGQNGARLDRNFAPTGLTLRLELPLRFC